MHKEGNTLNPCDRHVRATMPIFLRLLMNRIISNISLYIEYTMIQVAKTHILIDAIYPSLPVE